MTLVSGGVDAGGGGDGLGSGATPGSPLGGLGAIRRDLSVRTDRRAGRCVLALGGRLCSDTVAAFDRHVDGLGCRWSDDVVVDLAGLTVLDLIGARVLVGLSHYVAGRGGRFHIEGASGFMDTMLERAGIELAG